jgi:integrase/recombinase XerD
MRTTNTVSPLRQRMIEDMTARKLEPHSQRSHIHSCRRFAAFLKRLPDTATADDIRRFQLYLVESGLSIGNRNRIMTGVKFLFRVTLRRHDLAAEIYHLKEPQKLPLTMSPAEAERLLAMAGSLRDHVMLCLGTAGAPPPAISCLGAFPTPAVSAGGSGCHAGIRKPAQ